jgi:uncharacterized protein YkwD
VPGSADSERVSNLRALLTATALSVACSCAAADAVAAKSSHPGAPTSPIATIAHAKVKSHKHAHAACKRTHGRHHEHRRNCRAVTHGGHGRHTGAAGDRFQAGKGTLGAHGAQAKGARRQAETTTTVTLGPSPAAATIASVLATTCQSTELTPEAGNLSQVDEATLCLINQERARNNELPLRPSPKLTQIAQQHSEDMVASDYFSHTTPSGETQLERVLASGYIPNSQVGYTIGENIAWATLYLATPRAIVAAWIASPEHLANILNSEYRDSGIGVDPAAPQSLGEGQQGAVYTQEFGAIQG